MALAAAIRGRGAFRAFRLTLDLLALSQQWHEFQAAAYLRLAKRWCQDNQRAFTE